MFVNSVVLLHLMLYVFGWWFSSWFVCLRCACVFVSLCLLVIVGYLFWNTAFGLDLPCGGCGLCLCL